jgi:hypothetical protein
VKEQNTGEPLSLVCSSDASHVFVGGLYRIAVFDVRSGTVRPFADMDTALQLAFSQEGLYAARRDTLSVVDEASGKRLALDPALKKHARRNARGIAVLKDFVCIADEDEHCVHVIPRS